MIGRFFDGLELIPLDERYLVACRLDDERAMPDHLLCKREK